MEESAGAWSGMWNSDPQKINPCHGVEHSPINSVGININVVAVVVVVPLFPLLSALNFPAQPPWRMCNAVVGFVLFGLFSSIQLFSLFSFAFYQLKATSKAESVWVGVCACVCVCDTHIQITPQTPK